MYVVLVYLSLVTTDLKTPYLFALPSCTDKLDLWFDSVATYEPTEFEAMHYKKPTLAIATYLLSKLQPSTLPLAMESPRDSQANSQSRRVTSIPRLL